MIENWQPLLTVLGAIIGSGLIQFLITRKDKQKEDSKKNTADELRKELKQHLVDVNADWKVKYCDKNKETIDAMAEQHQKDFQALLEAIQRLEANDTKITDSLSKIADKQDIVADGIMGLSHDKLMFSTGKYAERGAITLKEKATLKSIYKPYKNLGGNGDCAEAMLHMDTLKVVSDEEAKHMDMVIKNNQRTIV